MFSALVILAQIYHSLSLESSNFPLKTEEYCHSEIFAPRCDRNQILVIENAIYGRKKFGRCLLDEEDPAEGNHDDPRFIGCYSDVKSLITPKCFGKQECDLRVAEIKTSTSCYKYLKLYLEVSYTCVFVAQQNSHCTLSVSQERQYLFGPQTSSCGSKNHPWMMETLAGQRLTFNGITFLNNLTSATTKSSCKTIGHILDKFLENSKIQICLKLNQQETQIYKSKSNQVELFFDEDNSRDKGNFLISVEAIGCSDLIPPADAWLKRTENEATIGCYSTRLRWQLKCHGQRWIGVIGNCSYGHVITHNVETEKENEKPTNQIVIVFMIVVAGLVMCLLIGCLGLVCLKRYYAIGKLKGLKQMNAVVENFQPVYDKDPSSFGANFGGTLSNGKALNGSIGNTDTAQYFELDQSLVNKELLN